MVQNKPKFVSYDMELAWHPSIQKLLQFATSE